MGSEKARNIQQRLREVLAAFPALQLAALFGSMARGGERPDSDLDLAG